MNLVPLVRATRLSTTALVLVAASLAVGCKSRTYNPSRSESASSKDNGEFPEPKHADAYDTFLFKRDFALIGELTTSSSWRKVCVPRREIPTPETMAAFLPDDERGRERKSLWENGRGEKATEVLPALVAVVEAKFRGFSSSQSFVLEKSDRADTFPQKQFEEAKAESGADGICLFNMKVPAPLLGLNQDAFKSNKDEANYEVNYRIDTDGDAGIDFYSLFLKQQANGELRKDSGLDVGLLQRSVEFAKGMGARSLTVYGSSVINAKIARVLVNRYQFVLVEGDGQKGSTYARKFDLTREAPSSGE